jgi:hypothetical protein
MINSLIEKEIFSQLNKLNLEQQWQVLNFARFLAITKKDFLSYFPTTVLLTQYSRNTLL